MPVESLLDEDDFAVIREEQASSAASSWDYKRAGYDSAVKVIRRVWSVRNHPGIDRMVLRRAIAQAQRCSR